MKFLPPDNMKHEPTILIVDDQVAARETLTGFLADQGYHLISAAQGTEALRLVERLEPDAILLDVMMPQMDGFEVCRRLKAYARWRHIPIILITALDSPEDLVTGLEAGADEFLSKPVRSPELRARVRSMLRTKAQYDLLKNQYQKLAAVSQLREDLTHMIMHDLRSPLTAIMGFSELLLLEKDRLHPQHLSSVEVIYTEASRLNTFTNDLLLLTKMEQERLVLYRTPVEVGQLVNDIGHTHTLVAKSKNISLQFNLPQESRTVSLDKNLFQRVLDNLLSNALKFAPPASTVALQVTHSVDRADANHVRIKIADEGPGIPPEAREQIFNKFAVVPLKQSGISQFGLRLAFAKMVVEAHGGRIFVEANDPVGSVFIIEI